MKTLIITTAGALFATVALFIVGLTSQSPVGFAGALLCGSPLFCFLLGWTVSRMVGSYRLVPKSEPSTVTVNGRARTRIGETLG